MVRHSSTVRFVSTSPSSEDLPTSSVKAAGQECSSTQPDRFTESQRQNTASKQSTLSAGVRHQTSQPSNLSRVSRLSPPKLSSAEVPRHSLSYLSRSSSHLPPNLTSAGVSRHSLSNVSILGSPQLTSRQSTSRQSLTSSIYSVSTSVTESDIPNEPDVAFPLRWENERRMDKGLKISTRKRKVALRLRKMSDVYDRQLQEKLRRLNITYTSTEKELLKSTHSVQEVMYNIDHPTPTRDISRVSNTRTATDSRASSNSPSSRQGSSTPATRDQPATTTCFIDPDNTQARCQHFPCCLPKTYNSLSVLPKESTYSVVSNYKQLLNRCKDVRPPTSVVRKQQAAEDPPCNDEVERHPARISVKERIRGVKQLVKEMQKRRENMKPREWATNYGEPMPRSAILKPISSIRIDI